MAVDEKKTNTNIDSEGNVCISDDVIATIASIATKTVDGVFEMAGSITGGFVELFGKKNPSKGVKVSITDNDVAIDIDVVVKFGVKIPDVAEEVQDKVKNEVEAMTGLNVVAVNVNVEGIRISSKVDENAEDGADAENAESEE
ncbi:MAG: Asp23/Gls24 family envelope stress response protein [Clostridia bacterium]|nr:Asp23/Gls24 family envelope stress response protein [Clostridia bacterium]